MQDGSETVCLGVDTLNTETLEVIALYTYSLEKFEGQCLAKKHLYHFHHPLPCL